MNINDAFRRITDELDRAEKIHPEWPRDIVYQAAIVTEEAGELLKAALDHKEGKGPSDDIIKEAVQVGAMAIRFLKNEKL
jgi:hypothetical protein